MGILPIDNLEIGMVLAMDVTDRTGRLLLGAGTELTQKHLVIFRTWGILEADIEGVDSTDAAAHLPDHITMEELETAEADLAPRFRHAGPEHPVVRELLRLAALKKIQNAPN